MPPTDPIYLDYNASTPLLPRVREAVLDALDTGFGNPSAGHVYGQRAHALIQRARAQIAAFLGCDADEIVLTGGGTESNNLALRGLAPDPRRLLFILSAVEHPATVQPAAVLKRRGATVVEIPVDANGLVDLACIEKALERAPNFDTTLVSVMLAQNETGVIQPISEIAKMARQKGALVHTDAAQAVGKVPVDVRALDVDLLSLAGHKLYAPKGVGALYKRRSISLAPLVVGAGHEHGLRPGTENVAGIVGLGEACAVAKEDLVDEAARQEALRERLCHSLGDAGFVVHGAGARRLPNTVNGRFPGMRGSTILARTPGIAATTGSACHAGHEAPSRALSAMGIADEDALGAIRLSFGRLTTTDEIDRAAEMLIAAARS